MRLSFLPRERRFYELFEQDIANIVEAAGALVGVLDGKTERGTGQLEIKALEHKGDQLTHEMVRALNRTFVTPFDREDIYALTTALDDVLDYIEEASHTLALYKIAEVPTPAVELGGLLLRAAGELSQAIGQLEAARDLDRHWIEVHSIENQADQVVRAAIGELFEGRRDPIEVMKLKDLYEILEDGLDRCEDVANIIENIVIKNA